MPFVKRQRMTALSYQRACLHAIDHLTKFGYSDIQAYMIPGSVPIEGRLSGVRPSASGPAQVTRGMDVPKASF